MDDLIAREHSFAFDHCDQGWFIINEQDLHDQGMNTCFHAQKFRHFSRDYLAYANPEAKA